MNVDVPRSSTGGKLFGDVDYSPMWTASDSNAPNNDG